jgi:hypothetical protein
MINLFVNYYQSDNPQRQKEFDTCLERNVHNSKIDFVCVIGEFVPLSHSKLILITTAKTPTFSELFNYANEYNAGLSVDITRIYSVIANSDIYFEDFLKLPKEQECFALLRWNVDLNGQVTLYGGKEKANSQDCWIFKGLIKPTEANFCMGYPGCDNRLAYELERAGYSVLNPALSFKSYHLHQNRTPIVKERIPLPYKFLFPTE